MDPKIRTMIIKLNKNQFDYLNTNFPEKIVKNLRVKEICKKNQLVIIEIGEEKANEIHDMAGENLQKKGFDLNYELTNEGKLLENLVDAFFIYRS